MILTLVWQRRQTPSQQVTTGPALMEGVERTNAVVVRGSGQGMRASPRKDPYMMEVDRGETAMPAEDSGTWPVIVEIKEGEG